RYARAVGQTFWWPHTRQVHGAVCHAVDAVTDAPLIGDAFVSATPGIVLHIRTADCLPILWWDPAAAVVGAIHAGWRGLAVGVISAALSHAAKRYGVRPQHVRAAIGPAIGPQCYEVGDEVLAVLRSAGHDSTQIATAASGGKWLVHLAAAAAEELRRCGVPGDAIACADLCTHCEPALFHSYRRAPGEQGRQVSFIGLC
ncbi:MAG: peptidoglycan editing factor PgeF, partial [Deltaproteobacteria bacterium]|nr:peptidoglycan editing factor PgeF [Deltaproteobacteria bacterium]